MRAHYLADKSALVRLSRPEVDRRLSPLLLSGAIATCSVVDLEMLYSSRDHGALAETLALRRAYERCPISQVDFDRAVEVMGVLSKTGQHRGVTIPDLLISAIAERNGLTVLHYDSDFDRIGSATGQAMEWVVPRGSVG